MTEIISIRMKYFISASLSVLLTIASLYYAFQGNQTIDREDNIQEQIGSVEDRLRSSDERIRCTEEHLGNMDERVCYVEREHNQRAYNQGCSVQEEDHGSREYNSQEVQDSQNQDSDQDYNEECDQGQNPNQDSVSSSRSDQEQDESRYQNEQKHVRTSIKTPRSLIIPKLD